MPGQFSGTAVIDRPIAEVFEFLAAGTNDPKFSPRVVEMAKKTEGPPALGTIFVSTVKDAGMTTHREFELVDFAAPTRIRWSERSKNSVTVTEGGYDLEAIGDSQTRVTVFNSFAGHGIGKLIVGFARKAAAKDAPAFAERIKAAVEAS
ncbi:SRPBCC family protein [Antrihabitans spumae]|uniref:SRPBCC family protein n=1 Tax=Antrihabitans spumae TaxID=3373370 RepID=A0ABW7KJG0_9NOCA